MWHIFMSKLSSSPDALLGVGLIAAYFVWILSVSVMRIAKGDHMHH